MALFQLKPQSPNSASPAPRVPVPPAPEPDSRVSGQLQPAPPEAPEEHVRKEPSFESPEQVDAPSPYVEPEAPRRTERAAVAVPAARVSTAVPVPSSFWTAVEKEGHARPVIEPLTADVDAKKASRQQAISGTTYKMLGEILLEDGFVAKDAVDRALEEQATSFRPLGEILITQGAVTADQVKSALVRQRELRSLENILRKLGLKVNHIRSSLMRIEGRQEPIEQVMRDTGYLSPEQVAVTIAAMEGMQYYHPDRADSGRFAEITGRGINLDRYAGFVPVAILGDRTLAIALEHKDAQNDAHNHFEGWAKVYVIASGRTLQKLYCNHFSKTGEQMLAAIANAEKIVEKKLETEPDGYIRDLIGMILRHACYSGASDIHLLESRHIATLAMRYDGVLKDIAYYNKALHERINNLLRTDGVESNVTGDDAVDAMTEGRVKLGQDKAIQEKYKDIIENYGFRLQLGKTVGENRTAVIRIIRSEGGTADLDSLEFDAEARTIIDECIHAPNGLVLLTGPTGSGKTTTLYAALKEIDPEENSIQTIENPVEAIHGKWQQYQVTNRQKMSEGREMALIFKGQMRNDPDAILVGEIRDRDVADLAIQASKTGHLVLSTLHVTRAPAALTRLYGLGVGAQDVADTLRLVIAQGLVRKLCPCCSTEDNRASTMKRLERALKGFLSDVKPRLRMARDGGCEECRYTGYRGRTMVYELMHVDKHLRKLIEQGAPTTQIEEYAVPAGKAMFDVGLRYVAKGVTSIDELVRVITDFSEG